MTTGHESGRPFDPPPPGLPTLPPPGSTNTVPPPPPPPPAPALPTLPPRDGTEVPIRVVAPPGLERQMWDVTPERVAAIQAMQLAPREEVLQMHPARVARYGAPVAPVGRMAVVVVALLANVAALATFVVAALQRRALMVDVRDGADVALASMGDADDRLELMSYAVIATATLSVIAMMIWMYRAYRTIAVWRSPQLSPGWAVFGWVFPVLNLVRPMQMMMEIVEVSAPKGRRPGLVIVWWVLWVGTALASAGLRQFTPRSAADYVRYDTLLAVGGAVAAFAGLVLLGLVVRATLEQRTHIELTAG